MITTNQLRRFASELTNAANQIENAAETLGQPANFDFGIEDALAPKDVADLRKIALRVGRSAQALREL